VQKQFQQKAQGSTVSNLNTQRVSGVEIAFPPLPDQQRIVTYLDAEFAKIEALKANAEKQLQAAKDLFQAALKELLTPKEGWVEKKLKEIGKTQTGCTPSMSNKDYYNDNYIPFVKPSEINYDGLGGINYETQMLSELGANAGRVFPAKSIFMVCIGATISKLGYSVRDVSCNQQINVITPNEMYDYKYIYYAMLHPHFIQKVIKEGTSAQATLPIISKGKWEVLSIKIPSLSEQQRIADRLDALSANVKALQTNYTETITLCNDLKQALLKKVFG
ncbi:MAG: restriction endonuclease subunit S, partial [Bacteroidales bacterium]|nr:restriction endonuclease subunit S [Bacteroidales bacterium]